MLTAEIGRCGSGSERCTSFDIYNILAFILAVLVFLPATPVVMITMKVAGERHKAWAVGLTSSFMSLLGFIPAPVIYGAVFDAHCLFWEVPSTECGDSNSVGHCATFDTKRFDLSHMTF